MGQEFHVVRCFTCQSFQVQQVKKANKWSCKLCGAKQSLLKEFGRGSGADCRRHVQKLNAMRGAMMEEQEQHAWSLWKQEEVDGEDEPEEQDQVNQTQVSRWSKYLDASKEVEPEEEEEEENVLMDRQQLHGNSMIDRKRKRGEGWTDGGGQDSRTPDESNWSSGLIKPGRTPVTTNSPDHTSLTHTRTTGLNHRSPPRKQSVHPPRVNTGLASRWTRFLSSDCQAVEGEDPQVSGRSQTVGSAAPPSCNDIVNNTRPRPPLPVPSLFESGEDFNFDEF
ncbi:MRN complex-interacting protein [Plectropomus leopardus]|uniref:MRN complex-interacting protein n=1 Tax=Plectropomus leopardus TaxID=160734 RepID=UPI001C4AA86F|nr:MRN complex-interacting protein [Plectropomus leopardus]